MRDDHPALPTNLYRAAQVREMDRIAIEELGIPGATLMDRAGRAAFAALRRHFPQARSLRVVCGAGNNAGDGFVLARYAREAGMRVGVGMLADAGRLRGDAREAYDRMRAGGLDGEPFAAADLAACDLIVDGLFGTGLDRTVAGAWADAIAAINEAGRPVLALDIPSGLDADSGRPLGACVRATLSISFIGLKRGMFTGEARIYCGPVLFDDLGVPPALYARVAPAARRTAFAELGGVLGPRARSAHKGRFGHVLVIGGDLGFAGAARLAGEGAARTGAGLVSLATRGAHAAVVGAQRPELMCHGVESRAGLAPLAERATVLAVGPGLGRGEWGRTMLSAALETGRALVLDADGLNLLAEMGGFEPGDAAPRIITPHPGEAARLLGGETRDVERDRFAACQALAERYAAVTVLKGAGSLVCEPGGTPWVCEGGNPGMASGGMGDVLTGVVAALLAQGLSPVDAARVGVCLHAAAADLAAARGERGLLAGDLIAELRTLVNRL